MDNKSPIHVQGYVAAEPKFSVVDGTLFARVYLVCPVLLTDEVDSQIVQLWDDLACKAVTFKRGDKIQLAGVPVVQHLGGLFKELYATHCVSST